MALSVAVLALGVMGWWGTKEMGKDSDIKAKMAKRDYRSHLSKESGGRREAADRKYVDSVKTPPARRINAADQEEKYTIVQRPLNKEHRNARQQWLYEAYRSGGQGESGSFLIRDKYTNKRAMRFSRFPAMHPGLTTVLIGDASPHAQPYHLQPTVDLPPRQPHPKTNMQWAY
jgi:hypothetical protein